jgi:hypothetical protein
VHVDADASKAPEDFSSRIDKTFRFPLGCTSLRTSTFCGKCLQKGLTPAKSQASPRVLRSTSTRVHSREFCSRRPPVLGKRTTTLFFSAPASPGPRHWLVLSLLGSLPLALPFWRAATVGRRMIRDSGQKSTRASESVWVCIPTVRGREQLGPLTTRRGAPESSTSDNGSEF